MNNEQIALIASAIVSNRITTSYSRTNFDNKIVTDRAEFFLKWLKEKEKEEKSWRNQNQWFKSGAIGSI